MTTSNVDTRIGCHDRACLHQFVFIFNESHVQTDPVIARWDGKPRTLTDDRLLNERSRQGASDVTLFGTRTFTIYIESRSRPIMFASIGVKPWWKAIGEIDSTWSLFYGLPLLVPHSFHNVCTIGRRTCIRAFHRDGFERRTASCRRSD
jgi:hypothetical protein